MSTTIEQRLRAEAIMTESKQWLIEAIENYGGTDTLFVVLRHVSQSGMTRWLDVIKIDENEHVICLSHHIARLCGFDYDTKRECLKVQGAGMDMGFHVIYTLRGALKPEIDYEIPWSWL